RRERARRVLHVRGRDARPLAASDRRPDQLGDDALRVTANAQARAWVVLAGVRLDKLIEGELRVVVVALAIRVVVGALRVPRAIGALNPSKPSASPGLPRRRRGT